MQFLSWVSDLRVCTDAAFVVAGVWGILTAVFLYPTYAGVGVTSLVIALTAVFTADKLRRPQLDFGAALRSLTPAMLRDAIAKAYDKQVARNASPVNTMSEEDGGQAAAPAASLDAVPQDFRTGKGRYKQLLNEIDAVAAGALICGLLICACAVTHFFVSFFPVSFSISLCHSLILYVCVSFGHEQTRARLCRRSSFTRCARQTNRLPRPTNGYAMVVGRGCFCLLLSCPAPSGGPCSLVFLRTLFSNNLTRVFVFTVPGSLPAAVLRSDARRPVCCCGHPGAAAGTQPRCRGRHRARCNGQGCVASLLCPFDRLCPSVLLFL